MFSIKLNSKIYMGVSLIFSVNDKNLIIENTNQTIYSKEYADNSAAVTKLTALASALNSGKLYVDLDSLL